MAILTIACWTGFGQGSTLKAGPAPMPTRLRWWADSRFGMFIHWGPVSLRETEISWSRANTNPRCPNRGEIPAEVYDNLYKNFNPTNFNAEKWVSLAKAAGMNYMVLTAKHCDGFLLWDSQVEDYNIMHTPFKRDVCAELARAAHSHGMRLGWYFSPMDWRDPDCRSTHQDRFVSRIQAELRELLTKYGKIDLLWFDCDGCEAPWNQAETYALVKRLQPDIVINNRLDMGAGDNPGSAKSLRENADYFTPEQWIGGYEDQHPWESCMTLSRRGQWSWGGHTDGVKSFGEVFEMLVRCAGGDGNVLLNVGPMPNGEIAPEQVTRLQEMGAWLMGNGPSIYGTRGGPYKPGDYGVSTRKGKRVFIHVTDWSEDPLRLPSMGAKVLRSRLLAGGQVDVRQTTEGLAISVPERDRQPLDTIVELELDSLALTLPAVDVPAPAALSTGAKASASNVFENQAEYGPDKAIDGRGDTRWATDPSTRSAWLEVDLGRARTFRRAIIKQAFPELHRIHRFTIEYLKGTEWTACYRGEDPGARLSIHFEPVTAQRVRLNLIDCQEGPTIWEFQLFE